MNATNVHIHPRKKIILMLREDVTCNNHVCKKSVVMRHIEEVHKYKNYVLFVKAGKRVLKYTDSNLRISLLIYIISRYFD